MRLVVIESPLSGDFERNVRYAKWCMLDSLRRGEWPFASHLLYTQCLDDENDDDRRLGMEAGFMWAQQSLKRVIYCDLGISKGMKEGIRKGRELGQTIEFRYLPLNLARDFEKGYSPKKTKGF